MKANEIQIGDWVCYDGDTDYSCPVKIEGMDVSCGFCITSDRDDVGFVGVIPIPLTPEILKKNGWRYDSELNNWWHEGVEFLIWHDEKIGFYCCNITTITLNEVHRLQHLLRLCGLNELADNFKV